MSSDNIYRFAHDTSESHSAWLWVTCILALTYSVLTIAIRGVVKWGKFGPDDATLLVGLIISVAGHMCIMIGLHLGLGRRAGLVDDADYEIISKLVYAVRLVMFIVMGFSQAAILLFVRHLYTREAKQTWRAINYGLWFIGIITLLSALLMTADCAPNKFLEAQFGASCSQEEIRFRIVMVLEIVAELVIVFLPIILLSSVQLERDQKVLVFIGFLTRLTLLPLIVAWFRTNRHFLSSNESNIGIVPNLICQQALTSYAIVLATAPCLRSFVSSFHTGGIREVVELESRKDRKIGRIDVVARITDAIRSTQTAFNSFTKRSEQRNELAFRPDLENSYWTRVWRADIIPEEERHSDLETIMVVRSYEVEYLDQVTPSQARKLLATLPPPPSSSGSDTKDLDFLTSAV